MLMRDLIAAAGHSAEPTDADEPTTDFSFVIAMGSSKVKIVCDQWVGVEKGEVERTTGLSLQNLLVKPV